MMREIVRIRSVVLVLVENGVKVDEDMVMRGYVEVVEIVREGMEDEFFLGGERGKRLVVVFVGN